MDAKKLIEIMDTAERLKNSTRHSWTSTGRHESVAEHSWRLALLAYFVRDEFAGIDAEKLLKMCLVHDLGEAFTGDIPSFEKTAADEQREAALLRQWVDGLPAPYRAELTALYAEMDARETQEAKVYKALDNLEAVLQHNEAPLWSWLPLEYELQFTYGGDKVGFSPYLTALKAQLNADSAAKIEAGKHSADYAVFAQPVATIYDLPQPTKPSEEWGTLSTIGDEGLYGQACRVLGERDGRIELLTFYGYHGYVPAEALRFMDEAALRQYLARPLCMMGRATDVLTAPKVSAVRLAELERGCLLERLPDAAEAGWAAVRLLDGRAGYVRDVALEPVRFAMDAVFTQQPGRPFDDALALALGTAPEQLVPQALARWHGGSEAAFRQSVIKHAKRYLGVEYRWGGKSGRGIDCSGLVSMAYMASGVLIYRDAKLVEGWPMHAVPSEAKKPGDALYFPGHIALYLGNGRYLHSTGASASGGVTINSLTPGDPLYREDLARSLYAVGSIF